MLVVCAGVRRLLVDGARSRDAIRFEPVKGWEAEKTVVRGTSSRRQGHKLEGYSTYYYAMESYRVLRCPLYEPDTRTRAKSAMPDWAVRARVRV